jgi:hypothetical protein
MQLLRAAGAIECGRVGRALLSAVFEVDFGFEDHAAELQI